MRFLGEVGQEEEIKEEPTTKTINTTQETCYCLWKLCFGIE